LSAIDVRDQLKERRLTRMRLGQEASVVYPVPSNEEVKIALVPLTEAEYDHALVAAVSLEVPDNTAGNQLRDRRSQQEILIRSMRIPEKLEDRVFDTCDQLREILDWSDINFFMDAYFELAENVAPQIGGLTEEEIDDLKKVFKEIAWNELSGAQWYALRRFLLSLSPEQLLDKLPGSSLTNP
jgi:hypothetical protein